MSSEKKTILRTVRLNPALDKSIQMIAERQNRTVSNTIYNILEKAINDRLMRTRIMSEEFDC